jgi:hypothetical protein
VPSGILPHPEHEGIACEDTIFLPPLCCYKPLPGTLYQLEEKFITFQHKMVAVHRNFSGYAFPDPTVRVGSFVMMDYDTGNVVSHRS